MHLRSERQYHSWEGAQRKCSYRLGGHGDHGLIVRVEESSSTGMCRVAECQAGVVQCDDLECCERLGVVGCSKTPHRLLGVQVALLKAQAARLAEVARIEKRLEVSSIFVDNKKKNVQSTDGASRYHPKMILPTSCQVDERRDGLCGWQHLRNA